MAATLLKKVKVGMFDPPKRRLRRVLLRRLC